PYCEWTLHASSALDQVMEITQGLGADVVVDAVGIEPTFLQGIEMCRMGGRFVQAGVHVRPVNGFKPDRIFRKDLTVVGAKGPSPLVTTQGVPLVFDYLERGIINPSTLISLTPF